tara:strand:+ start:886 stop:1746 length:861 start_codon:yes stop_codon:yes gene_type:complete
MKLSLGTAQFGMNYGISNRKGKPDYEEAERILHLAKKSDIKLIDTAIVYGDSEKVLGEIGVDDFKIITKLPHVGIKKNKIPDWIKQQVYGSLSRLKVNKIHGLLLHNSEDLISIHGQEIYKTIDELKKEEIITKIGISVYNPTQINHIISNYSIDIVQSPLNLFDRRLITGGWLSSLKNKNIEVHTRSCFLQGLLLMDSNNIPDYFKTWQDILNLWHKWLEENQESALKTCLSFPFSIKDVDKVIVGVDSFNNLNEIIKNIPLLGLKYPDIAIEDESLINPSKWKI